jgi:hypothetical protein
MFAAIQLLFAAPQALDETSEGPDITAPRQGLYTLCPITLTACRGFPSFDGTLTTLAVFVCIRKYFDIVVCCAWKGTSCGVGGQLRVEWRQPLGHIRLVFRGHDRLGLVHGIPPCWSSLLRCLGGAGAFCGRTPRNWRFGLQASEPAPWQHCLNLLSSGSRRWAVMASCQMTKFCAL